MMGLFRFIGRVFRVLFSPVSLGRCRSTEREVCNYRLRDITDGDYREVYRNYSGGDATATVVLNMLKRIRELEAKQGNVS